jgi:hypothetical protein
MNPCSNHAHQQDEDEERMKIIAQNGNTGEHYACETCGALLIDVIEDSKLCIDESCKYKPDYRNSYKKYGY